MTQSQYTMLRLILAKTFTEVVDTLARRMATTYDDDLKQDLFFFCQLMFN